MRRIFSSPKLAVVLAVLAISGSQPPAFTQTRLAPAVAPDIDAAYTALLATPAIEKLLDDVRADDARTLAELRTLTEIEAPPFDERRRAQYFLDRAIALGLDASIDSEGNVIGVRKGTGNGPVLLVAAHLDTVFPAGTDVTVKDRDGRLYAPGIADNTRGVAVLLSWLKVLNENRVQTVGDLVIAANVGEEGLGDLRGIKAIFRDRPAIDGFVGLEPFAVNTVTTIGTASHRYEVTFTGPGGHSFVAFGAVSATHAMGRAIAKISEIHTPDEPKTTFTVGTVIGGTSVNTIAGDAKMAIDIRSNGMKELLAAEKQILATLELAVIEENRRWGATDPATQVRFSAKLIGDRPGGETASSARIVQAAVRSIVGAGKGPVELVGYSTDANVPISLGIPAITLGSGGTSSGFHTRDEWWDPTNAWEGSQIALTTVLGLVGVQGVAEPVLTKRPR